MMKFKENNIVAIKAYDCELSISLGYNEDEDASADDMLAYYSKEDIKKYGVIAIKICFQ